MYAFCYTNKKLYTFHAQRIYSPRSNSFRSRSCHITGSDSATGIGIGIGIGIGTVYRCIMLRHWALFLWLSELLLIKVHADETSVNIPMEEKESTAIHDADPVVHRVREIRNEAMRMKDQEQYSESAYVIREAIEMMFPRVFGTERKPELYKKHGRDVGDLIHRKDSILLTQVLGDYGNILIRAREYDEAIEVLQDTVKYSKHLFGVSHPSYGLTLRSLADAYYDNKNYEEAIRYYKKLLFHVRRGLGLHHEAYMESGQKIGQCYRKLGKLQKAVDVYKKLLQNVNALIELSQPLILYDVNDDEYPELSLSLLQAGVGELYLELASVQLQLHDVAQAQFAARQAQSIFKRRDGAKSISYAFSLNTMSGIKMHENDALGAYKLLKKAHQIARKVYGDSHTMVIKSRENLDRVEKVLQEEKNAGTHEEL